MSLAEYQIEAERQIEALLQRVEYLGRCRRIGKLRRYRRVCLPRCPDQHVPNFILLGREDVAKRRYRQRCPDMMGAGGTSGFLAVVASLLMVADLPPWWLVMIAAHLASILLLGAGFRFQET